MTFLHGDSGDVPVWWSLHPVRAPVMVGWAGGPAGARLAGRSPTDVQDRAIAAIAENFSVSRRRVASRVEAFWTHDWQHDPFARGAYSYALVGGAKWATRLARSIEGTVWLAGEAADIRGARVGTPRKSLADVRA
jgi:hypothetical protein